MLCYCSKSSIRKSRLQNIQIKTGRSYVVGSFAERIKVSFLRYSYSYYLSSIRTLVTLLCPWIRPFAMIFSALRLQTSSEISGHQFEKSTETLNHWEILKRCGFLQTRSTYRNEKNAIYSIVLKFKHCSCDSKTSISIMIVFNHNPLLKTPVKSIYFYIGLLWGRS